MANLRPSSSAIRSPGPGRRCATHPAARPQAIAARASRPRRRNRNRGDRHQPCRMREEVRPTGDLDGRRPRQRHLQDLRPTHRRYRRAGVRPCEGHRQGATSGAALSRPGRTAHGRTATKRQIRRRAQRVTAVVCQHARCPRRRRPRRTARRTGSTNCRAYRRPARIPGCLSRRRRRCDTPLRRGPTARPDGLPRWLTPAPGCDFNSRPGVPSGRTAYLVKITGRNAQPFPAGHEEHPRSTFRTECSTSRIYPGWPAEMPHRLSLVGDNVQIQTGPRDERVNLLAHG